ncbi:MAG: hypothetical protein ACRD2J_12900 [Thermoanaerobaculia bacterium]
MEHVRLVTPRRNDLSSGIVCFAVEGMDPDAVVAALRRDGIVATVTPYATHYARLAPSIQNTPGEVDAALESIGGMA